LYDHAVGALHLTIGLWVRHGRPIHADVKLVAELQELPADELGPVVGDDGVRHPKPVDDVGEERHRLLCPEICDRAHLDPLGKLVDGNQQVGVAPGCFSQGPDESSPHMAKGHVTGIVWRACTGRLVLRA
jgi:hypothetical protein